MFLYDSSLSVHTLLEFGAKYNPMIAAGQYYRLITAMFLHSGIAHLALNMYALNILGKNIELVFGKVKYVIIYLTAGLFGSLGSFIFTKAISVGASGAIFGLFGVYIYLYIKNPDIFHVKQFTNLLTLIGINLVFGLVVPSIDNWAHIWGLIGGFIISWALGSRREKPLSKDKIVAQVLTVILIISSLLAGIEMTKNTWQYNLFKGIEHLKRNEILEAQHQFNIGISRNKNVEDFYFYLGHIYYVQGDLEQAKLNFKKALEINPNFTEAKEMLDKLS
ncbi:MAG: rhomboid protease GluP [Candidatus Petromonas sp.]|jgi:rhomboid protease GluP|nr:rhomboid protease GluP [Candidatus Petromonas sp.]